MASVRKKLDEKNLKTLRDLLAFPGNKHCFDCHQRGPTYVNVTIGSFVCTTCSGMLRGLTPPHRVKSITMATFSQDEIDFISARGNEYCRKIWLGLSDANHGPPISHTIGNKDEQALKDYMVSVYERKRYYVNPSDADKINGSTKNDKITSSMKFPSHTSRPYTTDSPILTANNNLRKMRNNNSIPPPVISPANQSSPAPVDPFASSGFDAPQNATQPDVNFANFDNNPVFANSSFPPDKQDVLSFGFFLDIADARLSALRDLSGIDFNPWGSFYQPEEMRSPPVTSHCSWSPSDWSSDDLNSQHTPTARSNSHTFGSSYSCKMSAFDKVPPPPSEDRYAALKDLDCQMKSQLASPETSTTYQSTTEWGQSNWTPNFDEAPQVSENSVFHKSSNPFSPTIENGWAETPTFGGNPFKTDAWPSGNGTVANGFPVSQSMNFNQAKSPWDYNATPNPFHVNGSGHPPTHHSSNPFL